MVYDKIPQSRSIHLFALLWDVGNILADVGIHSHLCGPYSFVFMVESFPHMCDGFGVGPFLWFNVDGSPYSEKDGGKEQ